jgi:hypothetical protein
MSPEGSPAFDHSSVENFSALGRWILIEENTFTFEMRINLKVGEKIIELRLVLSKYESAFEFAV